jgi:RNA polymerase sigma-70 factor (ECF subfamily)
MLPADPEPGRELASRIRDGDTGAFEELFLSTHAMLCEVVDAYVRSQDVSEEIVQDIYCALWLRRHRLEIRTSLRAYLLTAARNRALHHLRHREVEDRWVERTSTSMESEPDAGAMPTEIADEAGEFDDLLQELRQAIEELPPRTRAAVILRWRHGLRNVDVALALGVSVKAVEKLLHNAKRRLRSLLEPHRVGR